MRCSRGFLEDAMSEQGPQGRKGPLQPSPKRGGDLLLCFAGVAFHEERSIPPVWGGIVMSSEKGQRFRRVQSPRQISVGTRSMRKRLPTGAKMFPIASGRLPVRAATKDISLNLFDDIKRTIVGPAPETARQFSWLNTCAEPYAQRVRDLFECLVKDYPESHRDRLVARMRSDDDSEHRSAALELVMHAWLIRQGHEILAVEPELEHTPRSPDFLVRSPKGDEYFLEATARQEEDDRLTETRDAINAVESPVYLDVTIRGQPTKTISAKKIAQDVRKYIDGLDLSADVKTWPGAVLEADGAQISFRAFMPKSQKNLKARTIGMFSSGARMVSTSGDLDRVLKKKAGRYGTLDKPLIVAVTTSDFTTRLNALTTALFGEEATVINRNDPSVPARYTRVPNGIWRNHPNRWTNTGMSGVILIPDLSMTMFARRKPIFAMHPEPRHSISKIELNVETHALSEGLLGKLKDGPSLGEVFELSETWPE